MPTIEKRQSKDGKITHRVLVRLKGYPTQSATFERLTDAREWAKSTETAIKEGRHFKTAESKKHTVNELIDRYIKRLTVHNPSRCKDVKSSFAWWRQELGHLVLADLTKPMITEKIEKLSHYKIKNKDGTERQISPARVNRHIAALSHACTVAYNEWGWLDRHPMIKVTKLKEPRGRIRFLTDEERNRLLEACETSSCPYLYMIVVLALSTGARFNEVMKLKWCDVDLTQHKKITLHDTKNKERRLLPLTSHALELFVQHSKVRSITSDLVFPSIHDPRKPYNIRRPWDAAMKKAGIQSFRFHDLRHTAASYLAMNGASLAEIAEVLGHKSLTITKRYAHLSAAHTRSVVEKMNEKIFSTPPSDNVQHKIS